MRNSNRLGTCRTYTQNLKFERHLTRIVIVRIRIGTFNVNGQSPVESLRPWLCSPEALATPSDLIVLGFQELDLSTEALLITSTTLREDLWCEALMRDLAELGDQYVKVWSLSHILTFGHLQDKPILAYIKATRGGFNCCSYSTTGPPIDSTIGGRF